MRDRMERFVLLPFTLGCVSESSIAVGARQPKRSKLDVNQTPTRICEEIKEEEEEDDDDEEYEEDENMKSTLSVLALPKVQKLFKNFKNFSNIFVEKDEMEGETGMEIGFPTDIKHVTHIGLDGCATSILSKGWNNLTDQPPDHDQLLNLPQNFHLQMPFDQLPMANQADTDIDTPNIKTSLQNQMQKSF